MGDTVRSSGLSSPPLVFLSSEWPGTQTHLDFNQLEEHSKHFYAFGEIPYHFCDVFFLSFSFVEQKEKKNLPNLSLSSLRRHWLKCVARGRFSLRASLWRPVKGATCASRLIRLKDKFFCYAFVLPFSTNRYSVCACQVCRGAHAVQNCDI